MAIGSSPATRLLLLSLGIVWLTLGFGCAAPMETPDDGGTDAGADTGADGGIDGGFDGGIDDGFDGGFDGGLDGGLDGGVDAGSGGEAIDAPADTWTWVDFPESKCASGTPTGIGINPHAGASEVLFYFEGGGACSTGASCWGPDPGAAHVDGYDSTTFDAAMQRHYPILDRSLAGNPFRAMSFVYVPYCTGDMHAGTSEVGLMVDGGAKPTYFWGARDADLFLARVVPTFAGTTHVWTTGTSAGGFGTFLLFDHLTRAFGTRVDIVDDSGPPLLPKGATENGLLSVWGFVAPSGCAPCSTFEEVFAFDRGSQPNSRFAFLSFAEDPVISKDFGYTVAEYPAVMDAFTASLASDPRAATYIVTDKQQHVVETDLTLAPHYLPWLTQMVNDDPAWTSTSYAHP